MIIGAKCPIDVVRITSKYTHQFQELFRRYRFCGLTDEKGAKEKGEKDYLPEDSFVHILDGEIITRQRCEEGYRSIPLLIQLRDRVLLPSQALFNPNGLEEKFINQIEYEAWSSAITF